MEEGEFYAIETFGSTGKGYVTRNLSFFASARGGFGFFSLSGVLFTRDARHETGSMTRRDRSLKRASQTRAREGGIFFGEEPDRLAARGHAPPFEARGVPSERSFSSPAPSDDSTRRSEKQPSWHHSTTCGHPRAPVASISLHIRLRRRTLRSRASAAKTRSALAGLSRDRRGRPPTLTDRSFSFFGALPPTRSRVRAGTSARTWSAATT